MKIEWLILCEGIGTNANGAITAISINQNLVFPPALPIQLKRALIAHISDEGDSLQPGASVELAIVITSPSGAELAKVAAKLAVNDRLVTDFPGTLDFPFESILTISQYGTYSVRIELLDNGDLLDEATVDFHVLEKRPPTVGSAHGPNTD